MRFDFWWANLVNLFCLTGSNVVILLPLYLEQEHLPRWQIGAVNSAFSLAGIAIRFGLGGWLARYGGRPFYIWGGLMTGLVTLACGLVEPGFLTMVGLRILHGFALASYFTAIWARMVASAPPDRVNQMTGLFGISGLISGALGPIVAEAVLAWRGFPAVFQLGGCLCLVGSLLAFGLPNLPLGAPQARVGFWQLARRAEMGAPILGCLLFGIALGTFNTFIAPFVAWRHLPGVSLMFALYISCSVLLRLTLGRSADRVPPEQLIMASLLLLGGGLTLTSGLDSQGWRALPLLLGAGLVMGAGHGLGYPALSTLVNRHAPAATGMATTVFTAAIEVGLFTGALGSGGLAHRLGYPTTFLVIGVALAAGSLAFRRWDVVSRLQAGHSA